jgi:hypothetical protein
MKNRKNGTPRLELSPAQTADSKSEIQDDIAELFEGYDEEPDSARNHDAYFNKEMEDPHISEPSLRDPFDIMREAGFGTSIKKDSNGEGV